MTRLDEIEHTVRRHDFGQVSQTDILRLVSLARAVIERRRCRIAMAHVTGEQWDRLDAKLLTLEDNEAAALAPLMADVRTDHGEGGSL